MIDKGRRLQGKDYGPVNMRAERMSLLFFVISFFFFFVAFNTSRFALFALHSVMDDRKQLLLRSRVTFDKSWAPNDVVIIYTSCLASTIHRTLKAHGNKIKRSP
jgi:hypothetical protein